MYVPPAVLRLKTNLNQNGFRNNLNSDKVIGNREENARDNLEERSKPVSITLEEYDEQNSNHSKLEETLRSFECSERKTLKIKTINTNLDEKTQEETRENQNDFWYDIYNKENLDIYSDSIKTDTLVNNSKISKQSMVKLLQEQGVIRFNPIEYYKNTVNSQRKIMETEMDSLLDKVYFFVISNIQSKTIHTIKEQDLKEIYSELEKIINSASVLETIKNDFDNLIKNKPIELQVKYGFKYNQQCDFLSKFYELLSKEETIKAFITPKLINSILMGEKFPIGNFDKLLKKEGKTLGFINNKYIVKYLELVITINILERHLVNLNKKDKFALKEFEERLKLIKNNLGDAIKLINAVILPYKSIKTKATIETLEKSLGLYEFENLKDKIICEKEREIFERNTAYDEGILKKIKKYNYSNVSIKDLSSVLHSIRIETNKIPFMIQLLNYFAGEVLVLSEKPCDEFYKFIETYVYILGYIEKNRNSFEVLDDSFKKTLENTKSKLQKYLQKYKLDLYEIQMTKLYEYLEPLSQFDENCPKLDTWQKDVFEMIDKKKTVLSTYCSIISNKLLFVVPSAELARQVCGMIRNLILDNKLKKNIMLVTEKDIYSDNKVFDILVGTPSALERYFIEKEIKTEIFDYVVFDEIHQLNNGILGVELERFIKLVTTNENTRFLALSACVGNGSELLQWWNQFISQIELVVCNRRFLQQQKFLWRKGELLKMNPLSVCSLEFLKTDGFIGSNGVVKAEMSMTPDDLYKIYKKISKNIQFDSNLKPEVFFKSTRISLEDCKQWEWGIKKELQRLSKCDSEFIFELLNSYQRELQVDFAEKPICDLYELLKILKFNNMLPSILFRIDPNICQKLFTELVYYLKETESKTYPTYYDDLKIRNEAYLEMNEKVKKLDGLQLDYKKLEEMNTTPEIYLEERKQSVRNTELAQLQKRFSILMTNRIEETKEKLKEETNDDLREIYAKQLEYFKVEMEKVLQLQELNSINIYKPHSDFTFLEDYINSDHIIEYRKQLMDYMREEKKDKEEYSSDTYISYEHPFIMGIERGVILYLNRLPTPFQRVAQSLIASSLKLAPVTFSDKSLAFGINYPIRSVILTGGHIDPIIAHQMIGRAGRRGIDPKGYTIYYNVDWKTINQEKYLEVSGSDVMDESIWILPELLQDYSTKFDIVTKHHLKDYTEHSIELENTYEEYLETAETIKDKFYGEFDNELTETNNLFDKLMLDTYRNKRFGNQIIFMPYFIEEISRWKFLYNELDTLVKNNILNVCIAFLNGDLQNTLLSKRFRERVNSWNCINATHRNLREICLNDKITEETLENWISVLDLIGCIYELINDWRIKKVLTVIYSDIKGKIKKYTF
jgi:hypothetical protein